MEEIEKKLNQTFDNMFPIESSERELRVNEVTVKDTDKIYDFKKHKDTKLKNRTLTTPVEAEFELVDTIENKTIDKDTIKIIRLPIMSPRGSFVIDGNEYQVTHQLRLKAGVYTQKKKDGTIESQVNIRNLVPFKVQLDPETGFFELEVGSSHIGMYSFLSALGIKDDKIAEHIGQDLLEDNRTEYEGDEDRALKFFSKHMTYEETDDVNKARENVREFFRESEMDPETTERTLGESFEGINEDLILNTAEKLLKVTRGEEEEDDRDSLAYKKVMGLEDFLEEVIENSVGKIERSVKRNIKKQDEVEKIISPNEFNKPIQKFFTTSDMSTAVEITNPLSAIGNHNKITITGEGGIEQEQAITDDMININPSTFGFLDPVHTPESGRIGANLHISSLARKEGNELYTKVIDPKTGEVDEITPEDLEDKVIAFPDEYDSEGFKNDEIKVMARKEVNTASPDEVDYVLANPKGIFDITTNMMPFLQETQGNRAMMGGKMQEQALSLKERESPLVQSGVTDETSFEQMLGDRNTVKAPVTGEVTKVSDDEIVIKDQDTNKKETISIYDHYPLGGSSMVNHEPKVEKGDIVQKGDLIADSNFTDDGEIALGKNMKVGFMTYEGYTFEDGLVISNKAAEKMASEHTYVKEIKAGKDYTLDKEKYKVYFPNNIEPDNDKKLTEEGIIKEGETVEEGDVLVAAFKEKEVSEADILLNNIKNRLALDKRDEAIVWDKDIEGEVREVVRNRNLIKVMIKTEEKAKLGDKIVGRYGNKGTVTKVVPDEEMPRNEEGEPLELILNPHTVPSRMNPSQILETAASKIAEETGEPYIVNNFEDEEKAIEKIREKMDELDIDEKEVIVDPNRGELEEPVFTGKQYMMKLHHQSKKKFSARAFNEGYDMDGQPLRGGDTSGQALDVLTNYTLLAHGAKSNLKEMSTIKGTKNDEFWKAFQTGAPLPKPDTSPAFDKFIAYLESTGVKVDQQDDTLQLMAMTDEEVEEMSNGEIENAQVIRAKNLDEYDGGLLDPEITGGKDGGEEWAHIDLEQPVPNPVFEKPIKTLLDLKNKEYKAVLNGNKELSGKTGGEAIKDALSEIDVDSELESLKNQLDDIPKSRLDDAHKKIRYLEGLKKTDKEPTDYMMGKVPVIPPKFRPIYELPNGSLGISDINKLYRHIILANDAVKMDKENEVLSDEEIAGLSERIYESVGAMEGIFDPITKDARQRNWKGVLKYIGGTGGTQPKDAFFQSKVVKRRQDLSGRSTIVAGPELDVDKIGLPEDMAWKIYKPHIMKKLTQAGIPPHKARNEHLEDRSDTAKKMLDKVTEEVPVILNRAPSLHKFSTLAFEPELIDGKSIRLPNLTVTGFNADFDGLNQPVLFNCGKLLTA